MSSIYSDERMRTFINSLEPDTDPFLAGLEQEAVREGIPVIRHEMISFLRVFLEMKHPSRILEVGTAVGFSALVMAVFSGPECRITTIERDPERAGAARKNFTGCAAGGKVTLLEGDAEDILSRLDPSYDLIFMDAAKGQYIHFLDDVKRLLSPGGVLISDNVLQEGDLLESRFLVERRSRTIYKRMREYLYSLKHDPVFVTSIIPIADGAAVSVKRKEN